MVYFHTHELRIELPTSYHTSWCGKFEFDHITFYSIAFFFLFYISISTLFFLVNISISDKHAHVIFGGINK